MESRAYELLQNDNVIQDENNPNTHTGLEFKGVYDVGDWAYDVVMYGLRRDGDFVEFKLKYTTIKEPNYGSGHVNIEIVKGSMGRGGLFRGRGVDVEVVGDSAKMIVETPNFVGEEVDGGWQLTSSGGCLDDPDEGNWTHTMILLKDDAIDVDTMTDEIGTTIFLMVVGALFYCVFPAFFAISIYTTTCEGSTIILVLIVSIVIFALTVAEFVIVGRLVRAIKRQEWKGVRGMALRDAVSQMIFWLPASPAWAWIGFVRSSITGRSDMLDAGLDFIQPGQMYACEEVFDDESKLFANSFPAPIRSIVRRSGLFGIFTAFVFIALLLQGVAFVVAMKAAKSSKGHLRMGALARASFAVGLSLLGCIFELAAGKEAVALSVRAAEEAKAAEKADEMIEMELAGGVLDEGAVTRLADARKLKVEEMQRREEEAKESEERIKLEAVISRVFVEAVPSIYCSVDFFAMSFDHTSGLSKAQTIMCVSTSVITALHKALGALMFTSRKFRLAGRMTAVVIVAFVIVNVVKFRMIFVCPSHLFSVVAHRCEVLAE